MASTTLTELTQAALTRLRSPELNMRIVQLQTPALSSSSTGGAAALTSGADLDISAAMWKNRHGEISGTFSIALPVILIEYYKALQTDGLHFAASVSRSANGFGVSDTAVASYVCCCRLHRIAEIVPVELEDPAAVASTKGEQDLNLRPTSPTGPPGTAGGSDSVQPSPRTDGRVRCFVLSPAATDSTTVNGVDGLRSTLCDVLLVYRERGPSNNPEVWGRNVQSGRYFYLCRCIEDYIRLGCRMYWVAGWQLCFDAAYGPPNFALPWLRMLAPGPLSQALRT